MRNPGRNGANPRAVLDFPNLQPVPREPQVLGQGRHPRRFASPQSREMWSRLWREEPPVAFHDGQYLQHHVNMAVEPAAGNQAVVNGDLSAHWSMTDGTFEEKDDNAVEDIGDAPFEGGPLSRFVGTYGGIFDEDDVSGRWKVRIPKVTLGDVEREGMQDNVTVNLSKLGLPKQAVTCNGRDQAIDLFLYRCACIQALRQVFRITGGGKDLTKEKLFHGRNHVMKLDYLPIFERYVETVKGEIQTLLTFHERFSDICARAFGKPTQDSIQEISLEIRRLPQWEVMFGDGANHTTAVQNLGFGTTLINYVGLSRKRLHAGKNLSFLTVSCMICHEDINSKLVTQRRTNCRLQVLQMLPSFWTNLGRNAYHVQRSLRGVYTFINQIILSEPVS